MRTVVVVLLALCAVPGLAQRQAPQPAGDLRGEVLATSTSGALIGAALPAAVASAGCGALVVGQGDIGFTICGAFGVVGGILSFGPATSCGATLGAWMATKDRRIDNQGILCGALPGVALGIVGSVGLFVLAAAASAISTSLALPIVIGTLLLIVAAAPASVCGATLATPAGPTPEVPAPGAAPPRKRREPPPERPAPHPDAPTDGAWEPPEPPPPPLLPQMGY